MRLIDAKQLTYGQTIYDRSFKNADGTPGRWRVTGKIKLWKRDPYRIRVPLKHGLYDYGYIDEYNLNNFSINEDLSE